MKNLSHHPYAKGNKLRDDLEMFVEAANAVGVQDTSGAMIIPVATFAAFFNTKTSPFPRRFVLGNKDCRVELDRAPRFLHAHVANPHYGQPGPTGTEFSDRALAMVRILLTYREPVKAVHEHFYLIVSDTSNLLTIKEA